MIDLRTFGSCIALFFVLTPFLRSSTPTLPDAVFPFIQTPGFAPDGVIAADPTCDFAQRKCTVDEDVPLNFFIAFPGAATGPACLFADPRSLPEGASFPAITGVGELRSKFDWTPDECQAGSHVVHLFSGRKCFILENVSRFTITINVNDVKECDDQLACCLPSGMCADMPREACRQAGGEPRESGTTCASGEITCPVTAGACCVSGGTCVDTTQRNCQVNLFGQFMGPNTRCNQTDPPLVCTGACCNGEPVPPFTCTDGLTRAACEIGGPGIREFLGAGTVCGSTSCHGACCFPDSRCFNLPNRRDCALRLGSFRGRGVPCNEVTCPDTAGACCRANPPTCGRDDRCGCEARGGTFVDAGGTCPSPTKCATALGACCTYFDGRRGDEGFTCTDARTRDECVGAVAGDVSTRYLGDGTVCGDQDNDGIHDCVDACPNTPPGEPVVPPNPFISAGCSCSQQSSLCNDQDPCTRDICAPRDPGADRIGCLHRPIRDCCRSDADCNDNDACTLDVCISPACARSTISCDDDEIRCTIDRCDRRLGCNYPVHALCEDGDRCTANFCNPAAGGCETFPVDCGDDVPCTSDSCDSQRGCIHTPVHKRCDDLLECTVDQCDPTASNAQPDGCTNKPVQRGLRSCGDGDFNGDGVVDSRDLSGFVACLTRSGPEVFVNKTCPPGDRDGDGDVDLSDVANTFNNPFVCDPTNCEIPFGGVCVSACPPDQVCAPPGSGNFLDTPEGLVTPRSGGISDCRNRCRGEQDCFTSKCESCDIPAGQSVGACRVRCDPARCERCDGSGACRSSCSERGCEECREGRCVSRCAETEACFIRDPSGECSPFCQLQTDCGPCRNCVFIVSIGLCVRCEILIDRVCRDGVCLSSCRGPFDCPMCRRCADGLCMNLCPKGQICDEEGKCRNVCQTDLDCGECGLCHTAPGIEESFCLKCPDDFECLECGGSGRCQPKCHRDECEFCSGPGDCVSYCAAGQRCDGSGNCVPG